MSQVKPTPVRSRSHPRLISLEAVSIRLRDRRVIRDLDWVLRNGEHWAVLGPNGAGKTSLARGLAGELAVVRGRLLRHTRQAAPSRVGYISFERHQQLLVREFQRDPAREFSGNHDDYTRTRDLLATDPPAAALHDDEISAFRAHLEKNQLTSRGIRQLSTGEMRKVLITRCLQAGPGILILDEPFDGLDQPARRIIADMLQRIMARGTTVILITHRQEELLPGITHALVLNRGRDQFQGRLADLPAGTFEALPPPPGGAPAPALPGRRPAVIRMADVTVRYGPTVVFRDLNWTVRTREHWAVVGPNGAGKSTLMALVAADHPQAYANRIHLFGRRRGSGESIWEIKQRIGMVSFDQQVRYRKPISAFNVVLSGFFDTLGLYRRATAGQQRQARRWIGRLNLKALAQRPFIHLSHGERRLVLLARAAVKEPRLLILDEPCQGLDAANRRRVLTEVDRIAAGSQLIYVTHHPRELPRCITHRLRLPAPGSGGTPEITAAGKSV